MSDASVIICTYTDKRWGYLVSAVESVQHQTTPAREIIVVVDHNPALLEQVRAKFPAVVAVENHEVNGLSGARNSGVAASKGSIIVFLDDDAVAEPDWLEKLIADYARPDVRGTGGWIEPLWETGRPRWFPNEFNWVVGCTYTGMPTDPAPIRNPIGCNMSFRREVFDEIGGFTTGIGRVGTVPVGCEETEFCIRLRQRHPNTILLHTPQARVYHQVPKSRTTWAYFRSRCYQEGRSKALVSQFVGANDALASERTHAFVTLPKGVLRGIGDALFRRDPGGLARAGAIVLGLGITTAGYVSGLVALRRHKPDIPEVKPVYSKPAV